MFTATLALAVALGWATQAAPDDRDFTTHLAAKFQTASCTNCHEFHDKKHRGRLYTTHKGRTLDSCTDCHDQSTTGFQDENEWFARPGLYMSGMNAKKTCETVMLAQNAKFKNKELLAKQLTVHLTEDPRVLWAIEGATPMSGNLPEGKRELQLVKGGLEEWKAQVAAWIGGGMRCN